jgi:hypothetical protein
MPIPLLLAVTFPVCIVTDIRAPQNMNKAGVSVVSIVNNVRDQAQSIKHGEGPTVEVQYRSFRGSAGQVSKPGLVLLGATQRAVFFYDVNSEQSLVIPQAQIVSIEVREKGS